MNWKKLAKKLLFPPVWLMLLLAVVSAAGLTAVFVKGWEETPVAYAVYVLSFYTLSVITLFCCMVLPKHYGRIKQKMHANPLLDRYLTDRAWGAAADAKEQTVILSYEQKLNEFYMKALGL